MEDITQVVYIAWAYYWQRHIYSYADIVNLYNTINKPRLTLVVWAC